MQRQYSSNQIRYDRKAEKLVINQKLKQKYLVNKSPIYKFVSPFQSFRVMDYVFPVDSGVLNDQQVSIPINGNQRTIKRCVEMIIDPKSEYWTWNINFSSKNQIFEIKLR